MLGGMRRDRDGRYGNFHGLSGRKQDFLRFRNRRIFRIYERLVVCDIYDSQ